MSSLILRLEQLVRKDPLPTAAPDPAPQPPEPAAPVVDEAEPVAEPAAQPLPDAEPVAVREPESDAMPELDAELDAELSTEPDVRPDAEPDDEPDVVPDADADAESEPAFVRDPVVPSPYLAPVHELVDPHVEPSPSTASLASRPAEVGSWPDRSGLVAPLNRWSAAVAAAHDACFVLDNAGVVISISVAAIELLGTGDRAVIGRDVLDVINLVDFETGAPHPEYAPVITPLVVLEGPGLARSIMRIRHADGPPISLDTSSAPIHDATGELLGSVTFLAPIPSR